MRCRQIAVAGSQFDIPAGYIDHLAGNEINVPDEAGHEFIDRRLINLGRRTNLLYDAMVHYDKLV